MRSEKVLTDGYEFLLKIAAPLWVTCSDCEACSNEPL